MIRILLKKQLTEIFRSYFYNPKKNTARSRGAQIGLFALFALLMVGMLGGTFTMVSVFLCKGLVAAEMDWLFFVVMGLVALFLGVFGGVFSTYASLYLAKDNDLLLSMPVPVRSVMTARLLGVYLIGSMYTAVAIVPALIVYWVTAGAGAGTILAGVGFALALSLLVLALCCALGWVVARLSLKLKNKSFITVIISLLFFAGYYFVYFKATSMINTLVENAAIYGDKIKGTAYALYLFGRAGAGELPALAAFAAVVAALFALTWIVISKSFLKIATATGAEKKAVYREKAARSSSVEAALFKKELRRLTSSANYMLNGALGALFLPVGGVMLLIKGREISTMLAMLFGDKPGVTATLLFAAAALFASMVDTAAPSVSLEGRSIWILQSLPVKPWQVLKAKLCLQLLLAMPGIVFCVLLGGFSLQLSAAEFALAAASGLAYTLFLAMFGTTLSVRLANLSWTNEITPIKQGGSVMAVTLTGMAAPLALGGLYLWVGHKIGAAAYLGAVAAVCLIASLILYRWLRTKGAEAFANL